MHRELTTDERDRLLNSTTGRDGLLVRLLLLTGCRISEALNLRTDDVITNVPEPFGTIADLAGHNTIATTQRYIRITEADRVEAIGKL